MLTGTTSAGMLLGNDDIARNHYHQHANQEVEAIPIARHRARGDCAAFATRNRALATPGRQAPVAKVRDDKHADRKHIKPSVEDALKLRVKGENFAWRLSEELLRREVPFEAGPEKGNTASTPRGAAPKAETCSQCCDASWTSRTGK